MKYFYLIIVDLLFPLYLIAGNLYCDKAAIAFNCGDYAECIRLFQEGGMKEIKDGKRNFADEKHDMLRLAESYIAIGNYGKAFHALTDSHRVINKRMWLEGQWWNLTVDDLKNFPISKKPLMDTLFERFVGLYRESLDNFKNSPFIRNIVQSTYNPYSLNDLVSWAADIFYINAINSLYHEDYATRWYISSANYGKVESQKEAGQRFLKGIGIKQDTITALHFLEMACECGDVNTIGFVANCYLNGNGVKKDQDKAFKLFLKNADKSDRMSKYGLGLCYYYGYGTTQNKEKAIEYLSSVEDWFIDVPYILGVIYYESENHMAIQYFDMALSRSNLDDKLKADINKKLSACYRFGYCGVDIDEEKADKLYNESAIYGDSESIDLLDLFNNINQDYQ